MTEKVRIPVVLLVGAGHSGSTLMDLMFSCHSSILGVGEISYYSRLIKFQSPCACGKPLKECKFWSSVFKGVDIRSLPLIHRYKKDFFLDRDNYYYANNNSLGSKKYIKETYKAYRRALDLSGKKVIFDSSKSPDRANLLIKSGCFDVTIIHLVRNGKGVIYSNKKKGRSFFTMMEHWLIQNVKSEFVKLRNKNGANITVLYSDFVDNPETIFKIILKKVGLNFEAGMLLFQSKESHQIGGNGPVKLSSSSKIKKDLSWKNGLAPWEKMTFNFLLGWLNIFYKLRSKNNFR